MSGGPPAGLDPDQARTWLDRLGGRNLPVTPLLAARLATRRRTAVINMISIGVVGAAFLTWSGWQIFTDSPRIPRIAALVAFLAAYLALAAACLTGLWRQRAADRRIADTLRHRVALPVDMPLPTLLGRRFVTAAAVMYGAGAAVAALVIVLADDTADRFLAIMFGVGVLGFTGIMVAVLTDVARRPAIADDHAAMRGDALLRYLDARNAAGPYLVVIAVVQAMAAASANQLFPFYSLHFLVVIICFLVTLWPPAWMTRGGAPDPVAAR